MVSEETDLIKKSYKTKNYKIIMRTIFGVLLGFILFSIGFTIGANIYQRSNRTNYTLAVAEYDTNHELRNEFIKRKEMRIYELQQAELNEKVENKETNKGEISQSPTSSPSEAKPENKPDENKVAYITFDDGPTNNVTPYILDILSKHNIKATFFVVGKMAAENKNLILRESSEGHVIGNHTYSHDYKIIYANTDNFINDVKKCEEILKSILGNYNSKLIRFPGGSFGVKNEPYRQAITNAGYHFIDWNALNGDAEALNVPADKLVERLIETVGTQQHIVVLMHDAPGKGTTVEALPKIIEFLKAQGYTFKTLN